MSATVRDSAANNGFPLETGGGGVCETGVSDSEVTKGLYTRLYISIKVNIIKAVHTCKWNAGDTPIQCGLPSAMKPHVKKLAYRLEKLQLLLCMKETSPDGWFFLFDGVNV